MKFNLQKSLLSIVLVILMTFSILTPAVSAADGVTKVNRVWFALYEPANGAAPDFRLTSAASDSYELTKFTWTDDESGTLMDGSERYVYGKSYTAALTFKAKNGYAFDTKNNLQIAYTDTSHSKTYYLAPDVLTADTCTAHVSIVCGEGTIRDVTFILTIPHSDTRVSTKLEHLSSHCTLVDFHWVDDATGKILTDGDYFGKEGRYYTAELTLDADEGYSFADKNWISIRSNHTVFERDRADLGAKRITVRHSYLCTYLISVASMEIKPPVAGESPSYDAIFPEDAHYIITPTFAGEYDDTTHNGVYWVERDGTSFGRTMSSDEKFEARKEYQVMAYISPENDNYYIWLSHTFVNGEQGIWMRANGTWGGIGKRFICQESAPDPNYPLSVSVRSFLSETEPITIQLMQKGVVKYTGTCKGLSANYTFPKVIKGSYTMRISKKNHVTRDYSVTVSDETSRSAKICPIGDVNGDGNVTPLDVAAVNNYLKGKKTPNSYALSCADITGDGAVTGVDLSRINLHLKDKKSLWQ